MHELSLGQAIAETVVERAAGRQVRRVIVRVGHLRQVVPDSLQFAWLVLTEGSELDGCELQIEHVAAVVRCRRCDADSELELPVLVCSACQSDEVALVTGDELTLVALDIAEGVP